MEYLIIIGDSKFLIRADYFKTESHRIVFWEEHGGQSKAVADFPQEGTIVINNKNLK